MAPIRNLSLILDQGSHASRIAIFSADGSLLQLETIDISTRISEENFIEQDANEILNSLINLLNQIHPHYLPYIKQCTLCTQRSTLLAWNTRTGKPLSAVISWRDIRAEPILKVLSPHAARIKQISGLVLSAHYSASKINWLLSNRASLQTDLATKQLCIAPLASYLLFNLLKEQPIAIDHSNAQRSQLFDIHNLCWSDELLELFHVDKSVLPECKPVMHHYGTLKHLNLPLNMVIGDQNAAFYAAPISNEKQVLVNIGSGAFILSPAIKSQPHPLALLHTLSCSQGKSADFITEGTVNGAGAAISYAQRKDPCDNLFLHLPLWLKEITSPPIYINTQSGLGSPWWGNAGQPIFIGDNSHIQAARYVAIIESIIFLVFYNIQQLQNKPECIFISGGLSELDGLCQKLSDLSRCKILRYSSPESTAKGCANLLAHGYKNNDLTAFIEADYEAFTAHKNPQALPNIQLRYQQFVGELKKRCNSD